MDILDIVCSVCFCALFQNEIPQEMLDRVEVLPPYWTSIARGSPEQFGILRELVNMPREQRERLLQSSNARDRGIGLYVTAEQGELRRLLELKYLLDDRNQTVPEASLMAAQPRLGDRGYQLRRRTVSEYLGDLYFIWFGLSATSAEEFDQTALVAIQDPEHLVQPWIVRLHLARGLAHLASTPEAIEARMKAGVGEIKNRITDLPEEVRWAIVIQAFLEQLDSPEEWDRYYSEQEARDILRSLSGALKERIRGGTADLKFDPCLYFEDKYTEQGRRLVQEAARLLEEPQP